MLLRKAQKRLRPPSLDCQTIRAGLTGYQVRICELLLAGLNTQDIDRHLKRGTTKQALHLLYARSGLQSPNRVRFLLYLKTGKLR